MAGLMVAEESMMPLPMAPLDMVWTGCIEYMPAGRDGRAAKLAGGGSSSRPEELQANRGRGALFAGAPGCGDADGEAQGDGKGMRRARVRARVQMQWAVAGGRCGCGGGCGWCCSVAVGVRIAERVTDAKQRRAAVVAEDEPAGAGDPSARLLARRMADGGLTEMARCSWSLR